MKIFLIIILVGLIITGLSYAQSVTLDHVDGLYDGNQDQIQADNATPIVFYIRMTGDGDSHGAIINGFRVYSTDGVTWGTTIGDTLAIGKAQFDGGFFINPLSVTGSGADTIGFSGFRFFGPGLPAGYDDIAFSLSIGPVSTAHHNKTICLDSSFFPSSGVWEWAGPNVFPSWDGPHCFTCIDPIAMDVIEVSSNELPETYSISQNYPNPFNPVTNIEFSLPITSFVKIELFNILGAKIKTLVNEKLSAGDKIVSWDGTDNNKKRVTSGIYFYKLSVDDFSDTKKMVLLK